jgi:hypothetical protein
MDKRVKHKEQIRGIDKKGNIKTTVIHHPPEKFFYEDEEFLVRSDNVFNKEFIVKYSKPRVRLSSDTKLIIKWCQSNNLSGSWIEWEKVVLPIIHYFKIPKEKRLSLFQEFKTITLRKLRNTIKSIDKLILDLDAHCYAEAFYQDELRLLKMDFIKELDKRKKSYINKVENFRKRSGPYIFIYPKFKILFEKLEKEKKRNFIEIVYNLFVLFEFEDFQSISKTKALNNLAQIKFQSSYYL